MGGLPIGGCLIPSNHLQGESNPPGCQDLNLNEAQIIRLAALAQQKPLAYWLRPGATGANSLPWMDGMRVLVACEFSGIVREAFRARGHDAWSVDLLPSELPGQHIVADAVETSRGRWDLMIAHPPCTHLAVSGARWFAGRRSEQEQALVFVARLLDAPVSRIALENPVSVISSKIRKPDQIIQPWMFGHGEIKASCLWLKNLPKLEPTDIVDGRRPRVHFASPGPERWKERSRTLQGIAAAMAAQWGIL